MEPKTMQEAYRTPLNQAESRKSYVENHQDFVERRSYRMSQPLAQSVLALRTVRMPMPMVKKMMTGPMEPMTSARRIRPSRMDRMHRRAINTLPTSPGRAKYSEATAPVPAIMIDTTLNKNKIVTHSKNVPMYLPQ